MNKLTEAMNRSVDSHPDLPPTGSWIWLLAGVLVLAVGIRLLGVMLLGGYDQPWLTEYEVIAKSLREDGVFGFNFEDMPVVPSSFIPPLYPVFIAGITAVFPHGDDLPARVIQSFLSGFSVALTFAFTRELFRQNGVALLAALLAAVYPAFIAGALEISTVTPEVLLVQLFAYAMLRWHRTKKLSNAAWAGVSVGLLSLTRGPALLLAPLFLLWMLFARGDLLLGARVRGGAVFLTSAILVLSPWTIRNFVVHGALVPVSTNSGHNLWIGNNPAATGEFVHIKLVNPTLFDAILPMTEIQREDLFYQEAFTFIKENPQTALQLAATKAFYFWWFRPNMGASYPNGGRLVEIGSAGMIVSYAAMLSLAVVGYVLLRKKTDGLSMIGLIIVPYLGTSMVYFAGTRFRCPVEPFLIALASYPLALLARWVVSQMPWAGHDRIPSITS